MLQTVKVRLRKPTRIYTLLVRDIPLEPGDACVVRSDRGLEYGICVLAPQECPEEKENQYPMNVVRKATFNDENNYRQLLIEEEKSAALCAGKILQHNLPMRLVNVEYTLDRHKVIFYFTAEDRVDFRELVRDLAHELKTRIELRHIQVRDKSKIVGGLAACGRELCCATWLSEFMPISMKMAKRQNLSLNPTKISGQCGRLMCCLGYENQNYCDKKKKAAQDTAEHPENAAWNEEMDMAAAAEADEFDMEDFQLGPGETVYEIDPVSGEELGGVLEIYRPEPAADDEESRKKKSRRRSRRRRKRNRFTDESGADSEAEGKEDDDDEEGGEEEV